MLHIDSVDEREPNFEILTIGHSIIKMLRPAIRQAVRAGVARLLTVRPYSKKENNPLPFFTEDASPTPNTWKQKVGEGIVSLFNINMDKFRAAPVAGGYYYNLCKAQALVDLGDPLSKEENKKDRRVPVKPVKPPVLSETAKFWYEELGMPMTFARWFQIVVLHEWMLFVRMRALPPAVAQEYQQLLVDAMFVDIEKRLSTEIRILSNRIIQNYMKDFNLQLRGAMLSYDEGLIKGDAVLAAALWRNLFDGDPNVDAEHVKRVVGYVRAQLYLFEKTSDRDFAVGHSTFIDPWSEYEPLTKEQEAEMHRLSEERRQKEEKENAAAKSKLQ